MRNVIITGGSRGIGEALVRLFASKGDRVVFTFKNSQEKAERLSKETGALAICADSESEAEIINATIKAKEYFGGSGVDILVNNAAISEIKLFSDVSTSDWNRMININLNSHYIYTREVLSDMIRKKSGRIVNISSVWGVSGASCEVHYSTAKSGIIGMTKALAKELAPSAITVNCVAPGVIDTEMNAMLDADTRKELCNEIPLGRFGTAAEIASTVGFLCSDDASYITGQVISVDGGWMV